MDRLTTTGRPVGNGCNAPDTASAPRGGIESIARAGVLPAREISTRSCSPSAGAGHDRPLPRILFREFDRDWTGNESGRHTASDQLAHTGAAAFAVVERRFVHVHANERVGFAPSEAAGVLHCMIECGFAMREAVGDALLQVARDPGDELRTQVLADHIAAEGEGEAGFL